MSLGITAIAWPIFAGICIAAGFIHLLMWLRQRQQYAYLAFFAVAISVAALVLFELLLLHAQTPAQAGRLIRWAHVPVSVFFIASVVFIRIYLEAGRRWLAWVICGTRLLSLALNFVLDPNIHYREITALQPVRIWGGEIVSMVVGVPSPWQLLAQLSALAFIIFCVDATITGMRRAHADERRRALMVGGSFVLTLCVVMSRVVLIHWSDAPQPFYLYFAYLLVVLAISNELGVDVIRARLLAEQLRQERLFLRQIIDMNPNQIFVKDPQGRFTLANKAVANFHGTTVDELIGKTAADFNSNAEEVRRVQQTEREIIETLQQRAAEERVTDAAGAVRWLQTVKMPVESKNGAATYVLATATDISAHKQAELDIASQRNQLAHLSRVMMLSELSGSLAHELNQPLAAILSNAQAALRFLAQDDPDIEEIREILRDIVTDDKRAGEVIQGLRALLKRGEARFEAIDPAALVDDVLRLLRSDMLNAGVACSAEIERSLPKINGVFVQLEQVLLNLMINGCDAMTDVAAADRRLVISARVDAGNSVVFCVRDQGHGIAERDIEQVFEPFFTTKPNGLGLGLAVCRRIIDAHHGYMWATNNPTGGASVCFSVPIDAGEHR